MVGCNGIIGKAVSQIFNATHGIDFNQEKKKIPMEGFTIVHICIPFSNVFVDEVVSYISELKPDIVLVHSTIEVGTTNYLRDITRCHIVHCPIDGVHEVGTNKMVEDIRRYGVCVGGIHGDMVLACPYIHRFGVTPFEYTDACITESCKIWATERMRTLVEFDNKIAENCREQGWHYTDWLLYLNRIKKVYGRLHTYTGMIDHPLSGKHCLSGNKGLIK